MARPKVQYSCLPKAKIPPTLKISPGLPRFEGSGVGATRNTYKNFNRKSSPVHSGIVSTHHDLNVGVNEVREELNKNIDFNIPAPRE